MHHNHDAFLAKLTSAQIANQNGHARFHYSVLALLRQEGAADLKSCPVRCDDSSPYQSGRLSNTSRYCCATLGLFHISLGDVSMPRSVMTFVYYAYIDEKEANLRAHFSI